MKGTLERSPGSDDNWVERSGGLPRYIKQIALSLHQERGMSVSRAIATAVNTVKRWAAGGDDVKPDTRAQAAKAVIEWEALKARNRTDLAHPIPPSTGGVVAFQRPDTRRSGVNSEPSYDLIEAAFLRGLLRLPPTDLSVVDLAPGDHKAPYDWKHGYIPITPAAALSKAKGDKKAAAKYMRVGGSRKSSTVKRLAGTDRKITREDAAIRMFGKDSPQASRAAKMPTAKDTSPDVSKDVARSTATRLGAKPRSERTPAEQEQFTEANRVLRGEKPGTAPGKPYTEGTKPNPSSADTARATMKARQDAANVKAGPAPAAGSMKRATAKDHGLGSGGRAWITRDGEAQVGSIRKDSQGYTFTPDGNPNTRVFLGGPSGEFEASKIEGTKAAEPQTFQQMRYDETYKSMSVQELDAKAKALRDFPSPLARDNEDRLLAIDKAKRIRMEKDANKPNPNPGPKMRDQKAWSGATDDELDTAIGKYETRAQDLDKYPTAQAELDVLRAEQKTRRYAMQARSRDIRAQRVKELEAEQQKRKAEFDKKLLIANNENSAAGAPSREFPNGAPPTVERPPTAMRAADRTNADNAAFEREVNAAAAAKRAEAASNPPDYTRLKKTGVNKYDYPVTTVNGNNYDLKVVRTDVPNPSARGNAYKSQWKVRNNALNVSVYADTRNEAVRKAMTDLNSRGVLAKAAPAAPDRPRSQVDVVRSGGGIPLSPAKTSVRKDGTVEREGIGTIGKVVSNGVDASPARKFAATVPGTTRPVYFRTRKDAVAHLESLAKKGNS